MKEGEDLQTQLTEALKGAINAGLDRKSTKEELVQSLINVTGKTISDYINRAVELKENGEKKDIVSIEGRRTSNNYGYSQEDFNQITTRLEADVYGIIKELGENIDQPRIMVTLKKINIYVSTAVCALMKATGEFLSSSADVAEKEVDELKQDSKVTPKKGGFLETFFGEMAIAERQNKALDDKPIEDFYKALDEHIGVIKESAENLITNAKAEIKKLEEQQSASRG